VKVFTIEFVSLSISKSRCIICRFFTSKSTHFLRIFSAEIFLSGITHNVGLAEGGQFNTCALSHTPR
jgi:hypothetical protein